jgi:diaminopimelate epimerase
MNLVFHKYHGTGNDFILIDNRKDIFRPEEKIISALCHRRLGIGADGLMTLNSHPETDFAMKYYNADGHEGTMCGNGGRCITAFARFLKIIDKETEFSAIDGVHKASILSESGSVSIVSLQMQDVIIPAQQKNSLFFDTGSPHYIEFVNSIEERDIFAEGKKIRWDKRFQPGGTNVNFVELDGDKLKVVTFERGVEDVTLSCGTGVTASALAAAVITGVKKGSFDIRTDGGGLKVYFENIEDKFTDIWLEGPAERVFSGEIEI